VNNSNALKSWEESGELIKHGSFEHQVFIKDIGDSAANSNETLLLLHGFPESSFSFNGIIEGMKGMFDRIILFDMIGYGFSDKPITNYSYSLIEQADLALKVWQYLGVKGGHLLAHDMGDSVATELAARHVHQLLPSFFSEGFKSFTFTNGSMVLELAELRITQKILLSKYGKLMGKLVSKRIFSQQIKSANGNDSLNEESISELWELNMLQNGHQKSYLTIKYLNDRKQFEKTRWLTALSMLKLPIHICWGTDDAVARVEIAHYLKDKVCPNAKLTLMKGLGHFCQIDSPNVWVEYVSKFYKSLNSD
jgi:pimeloyl-ACP methyl ester carboxylesterase